MNQIFVKAFCNALNENFHVFRFWKLLWLPFIRWCFSLAYMQELVSPSKFQSRPMLPWTKYQQHQIRKRNKSLGKNEWFFAYHLFTLVKLRAIYFPRKIVPQNLARVPSKINLKIQINVTRIYDKAKVAVWAVLQRWQSCCAANTFGFFFMVEELGGTMSFLGYCMTAFNISSLLMWVRDNALKTWFQIMVPVPNHDVTKKHILEANVVKIHGSHCN